MKICVSLLIFFLTDLLIDVSGVSKFPTIVVLLSISLFVAVNKRQRRKGKIYPSDYSIPKNSKEAKKSFLSEQCKEIEGND